MHVVFYEAFAEEADALRRHCPEQCQAEFTWKTVQEAGHREPPAPVISVRTQSVIPTAWAGSLDGILSRSTGYDHLVSYRQQVKPPVNLGYLPLYCNRAVAEQAMLLWMGLLRRLPRQMAQFKAFDRDGLTGTECREKTLAVIGVGNIGHEVVDIGRGLGMRVLGVDPVRRWDDVSYVSFDEAAPEADVLVLAMNLTDSNRGWLDETRLGRLKPGAVVVNVARGELLVLQALAAALADGAVAGAGLDVFDDEAHLAVDMRSGSRDSESGRALRELASRHNVIFTPHNAFNTVESVERKAAQSMQQVTHLARHGRFHWAVPED